MLRLTWRRMLASLSGYALIFVCCLGAAPLIGGETIDLGVAFRLPESVDAAILFQQRIPRVILAALAGGALAVVGACLQGVFRNPLAEPYTLGITGGSAVGAVLAILIPALHLSWGPFSTIQATSLLGAALSLGFIYAVARRAEGVAMNTLLLAGVTVSILCGGVILMMRYLASPSYLLQMDRWLMGGLDVVGYRELAALAPLLLPGLWLLFSCMVEINHLTLGREMAMGHGVDAGSVQRRIFFGGGMATAAVVSVAGPIGFVGLIAPHAVRRLSGYDHRIVLPASFLLGGAFLTLCDVLARTALAPREIPVGVITAMVGGPLFISILLRRG